MATCKAVTKTGKPCRVKAREDGFCIWHSPDPEVALRRSEAQVAGGQAARRLAVLESPVPWVGVSSSDVVQTFNSPSPQDTIHLLTEIIDLVLTGKIAPQVANCAVYAIQTLTKVQEVAEFAERLRLLEEAILNKG